MISQEKILCLHWDYNPRPFNSSVPAWVLDFLQEFNCFASQIGWLHSGGLCTIASHADQTFLATGENQSAGTWSQKISAWIKLVPSCPPDSGKN